MRMITWFGDMSKKIDMCAQMLKMDSMEELDFGLGKWIWCKMASQNNIMTLLDGLCIFGFGGDPIYRQEAWGMEG